MNLNSQLLCQMMKIDPRTGRKLRPKYNRRQFIDLIKRTMYKEIRSMDVPNKELEEMIDRVKGGYRNSSCYYQEYAKHHEYMIFNRLFGAILRNIINYK